MAVTRVGIGEDIHRLVEGRRFLLGGVQIDHPRGTDGHSDADVLIHALIDALLGAAGLCDIGSHFPDRDPKWKGAAGLGLLAHTVDLLNQQGFKPSQMDAIIHAQAPRLEPYRGAIRQSLASALGLAYSDVNVKFKTGEGMGSVGREEAVRATVVALVEKITP